MVLIFVLHYSRFLKKVHDIFRHKKMPKYIILFFTGKCYSDDNKIEAEKGGTGN